MTTFNRQQAKASDVLSNTYRSLLSWEWTKKLLHWLIISAGTMSECVFLIASLWMSINSSVHTLVLSVINEATSVHLSEIATASYVALPELILGLAFVTTLNHLRVWLYSKKKDGAALAWSVFYGLPTIVFLVLSLFTLGNSVVSVNFQMPIGLVVIRAMAGYWFAFISLLHTQLGLPAQRERLREKDELIAQLKAENAANLAQLRTEKDAIIAQLKAENAATLSNLGQSKDQHIANLRNQIATLNATLTNKNAEMENQNQLLQSVKQQNATLQNSLLKSDEDALQGYSHECKNWLKSGVKTANVDEINHFSGHSKRKIEHAISKGLLQTSPRNKELILVSSLIDWLKTMPLANTKEVNTAPFLQVINNEKAVSS